MRGRAWLATLAAFLFLVAFGCGGGGGGTTGGTTGGGFTLVGRVIWASTGAAPNPQATVQVGAASTLTDPGDGSFLLDVASGSTAAVVVYRASPNSDPISFTFTFQPIADGVLDIGDLWIGPTRVTVIGRVLSTADNSPIAGATVRFAGRSGQTDASGAYALADVAYDPNNLAAFLGIQGVVTSSGFNAQTFFPDSGAVDGVVTIPDVLMSPVSDPNPPPTPYNIWGVISPQSAASGTIVTLLRDGLAVRQFNVGADQRYAFWITQGTYTLRFRNPGLGLSAPDVTLALQRNDEVIRKDATLQ